MIVAAIKIEVVVDVLAPNVTALDSYRGYVEARVAKALPAPSRTRTDKATGVRVRGARIATGQLRTLAREGGEA